MIAQGSDAVLIRGRPGRETGMVIDETTGSRRVVSRSGYEPLHVGGGWVMFWNPFGSGGTGDPAMVALYRVSTGQWRIVRTPGPTSPSCGGPCGGGPAAIGRYWLAYGNPVWRYQNINSGQVRQDPTTATTVPDLDSRSLSRAVCRPLRVPPSYNPPKNLGSLTFDGQFAIAESQGPPIVGAHGVYPGLESFVLERCGTHLHKMLEPLLTDPRGRNTHALMTTQGSRQLTGILLPSLRSFTINLSKRMAGGYFALTERDLYWVGYDGRAWVAASPGLPPVTS